MVRRRAIPSRAEVTSVRAASAVRVVHRGCGGAEPAGVESPDFVLMEAPLMCHPLMCHRPRKRRSSSPGDAAEYWTPAFAGMTPQSRSRCTSSISKGCLHSPTNGEGAHPSMAYPKFESDQAIAGMVGLRIRIPGWNLAGNFFGFGAESAVSE